MKNKCDHIYLPIPSSFLTTFGADAELNKCVLCNKEVTISETPQAYYKRQINTFEIVSRLLNDKKDK